MRASPSADSPDSQRWPGGPPTVRQPPASFLQMREFFFAPFATHAEQLADGVLELDNSFGNRAAQAFAFALTIGFFRQSGLQSLEHARSLGSAFLHNELETLAESTPRCIRGD